MVNETWAKHTRSMYFHVSVWCKHPRRNASYYNHTVFARNNKILRSRNKKKTDTLQVIKDNQQLSSQSFRSIIRFLSACQNPLLQLENSKRGGEEGEKKEKKDWFLLSHRSENGRRRKRSTLGGEASTVNGTSWNEITRMYS